MKFKTKILLSSLCCVSMIEITAQNPTDTATRKDYGAPLSPSTFSWATGDSYAAQCTERV